MTEMVSRSIDLISEKRNLRIQHTFLSLCCRCFARLQYPFVLRACLHGGGGPQIGEVTWGESPHLSCKRDQI